MLPTIPGVLASVLPEVRRSEINPENFPSPRGDEHFGPLKGAWTEPDIERMHSVLVAGVRY